MLSKPAEIFFVMGVSAYIQEGIYYSFLIFERPGAHASTLVLRLRSKAKIIA